MSAAMRNDDINIHSLPVSVEQRVFNDWTIKATRSHILHSQCTTPDKCIDKVQQCQFCIYNATLDLPHLPEMVFPNNTLSLTHLSGATIRFKALDALAPVKNHTLDLKVACAEAWKETRDQANMEEKIKPFDWTFTTDYVGSLSSDFTVENTDERIDIERLKQKEKILFYEELMLFEDELHDNGTASCTVKIRVMPSSYFVLLRYFLRVDNVLVRINDTRFFHDFNTNYVLREYSNRESSVKDLSLPLPAFGDPNLLLSHLPLCKAVYHKLLCPDVSTSSCDVDKNQKVVDKK